MKEADEEKMPIFTPVASPESFNRDLKVIVTRCMVLLTIQGLRSVRLGRFQIRLFPFFQPLFRSLSAPAMAKRSYSSRRPM
jgi:hypothetical protein